MPGPKSAARRRACHVVRGARSQRTVEKRTRSARFAASPFGTAAAFPGRPSEALDVVSTTTLSLVPRPSAATVTTRR